MDDERITFDLNEYLKQYLNDPSSVPCDNADPEILGSETLESFTKDQVDRIIDPIVDAIAESPEAISRAYAFDSIQCFLKLFPTLSTYAIGRVFDVIVSGFAQEAEAAHQDVEADEQETIPHHRQQLEMYGFLLQWFVQATENAAAEKSASAAPKPKGKATKAKAAAGANKNTWDSSAQLLSALDTMTKVLRLKLQRIFPTNSERDSFVQLLTRPSYVILESEQRVKSSDMRMHVFKVLCMAIKHHGHAFGAQTSIVQSLSYFDHLSEPMAEFLQILAEQYDYPQLIDEILRELLNKEYNSNDTKGPKSVSTFISKLSQLVPRLVSKQMVTLIRLLDNESYTLRCAIIDVCGNLIIDLTKQDELREDHKKQIEGFFDILQERFLDINPYCRSRAIQVSIKLCDLEKKWPKRRQRCAELATRSLEDKSSHVRRNAIKLITKLVQTHPFDAMHGGRLQQKEWANRLAIVEAELDTLQPAGAPELANETVNTALLEEPTQMDIDPPHQESEEDPVDVVSAVNAAIAEQAKDGAVKRLQLQIEYYTDALAFIETLHTASHAVCQLLSSKNKNEVIEAMDFFVTMDAYHIETSKDGIKKMLRLIWTKGNSDDGKGIQSHVIDCYRNLYFDPPDSMPENEANVYVARNMINMTYDTSPAELSCLEQLLSMMMKTGNISDSIITKLWQVYGYQKKEISKNQRRGAIIVLGMLAIADPDIIVRELETLLKIGLGNLGKADYALARYTCTALQNMVATSRQQKEGVKRMARLPNEHAILIKLAELLEIETENREWYGLAEQAIGAVYVLSNHPDVLCTEVLRRKTKSVFSSTRRGSTTATSVASQEDIPMTDVDAPPSATTPPATPKPAAPIKPRTTSTASALSQLLFMVGHVAIKQIVHLEYLEMDFKRRKAAAEKSKQQQASPEKGGTTAAQIEQDELDLIGGTTEDDFSDKMAIIRERQLLYDPSALLTRFGPLVKEICDNFQHYPDRNLQAVATLCMAKLMCVSQDYCEQNLNLLINILTKSSDPITRSNVVIALGDMAVCFNNIIDENTDFLYNRLQDPDTSVKRTCLMTLTFLILAGQVKVKGQLGEMAKCLEDSDKRIADLSRMFFSELAGKDNAIYNHFIDMFSLLSKEGRVEGGQEEGVEEIDGLTTEKFRKIIKFLCGFIEKDKHARQLADKLASRLARCETEQQWNDVAYALSLLQHKNEEITKTIQAGFRVVQAAA